MTSRRHIGLVAGGATLLAALPLSPIFAQWTWLVKCLIAVVLIEGAAMLARTLRAPIWAQIASMVGALLVVLTFLTPDSKAILGLIPTTETFTRFGQLLTDAGTAMREMGIPVSDHDGLLFLTVLGVGAVAVCVDICAVILRRPALAGLPMLAIYSVPVAVAQDAVPVLPFIAGAAGFLWLLVTDNVDRVRRFGRRFTGDGRDVDVWEPSPLAAAGRRLAIVGVLIAVVLPLAVPGMTTGLLDRFGTGGAGAGGSGTGGSGRQVNLWAMLEGTLKQSEPSDMVRVQTADPAPGYLRFGVADDLRMDGFRNRPPSGTTSATNLPARDELPEGVSTYQGHAIVDIASFNMRLLPVYNEPVKFTRGVDSTWFYDRSTQVIYSARSSTLGKKYEFDYVRYDYDRQALATARPLPPNDPIQQRYTVVPEGVAEVEALVSELIQGKTTEYDKVRALYDYFSSKNNFRYSLDATSDTGGLAIVEFLERKTGYCVQYAAALAWMVREAGIPARVAFGFTRGIKDTNRPNTYTLTNQNLHAWTEVYFNGFGWLAFDATPATFITGSVNPAYAPDPDAPVNTGPDPELVPGPNPSGTAGPGGPDDDNTSDLDESDPFAGGPTGPASPRWPGYLAIGALVLLFLLVLPAARRSLLRRNRRPVGVPAPGMAVATGPGVPLVTSPGGPEAARARHDAHAAWDELIDTLVDFRLSVDPAETPRTTAARVVREASLRDNAASGAELLGKAEERARYARIPLASDGLGSSLKAVRRALAVRASRRTRVTAALFPPSVLQRWRLGLVSATATVVDRAGHWRNTLVRALSPRRLLPSRSTR